MAKLIKINPAPAGRPSALIDTRVIYCGDNLEQLAKLPDHCVDLVYIDPPFNSNRNYEVFWGERKRTFDDRRISTQAYIDMKAEKFFSQRHRETENTEKFKHETHERKHARKFTKLLIS